LFGDRAGRDFWRTVPHHCTVGSKAAHYSHPRRPIRI